MYFNLYGCKVYILIINSIQKFSSNSQVGGVVSSKSIKERCCSREVSRSVQLTAETMATSATDEISVEETEVQPTPVAEALARLEDVIETKISSLK